VDDHLLSSKDSFKNLVNDFDNFQSLFYKSATFPRETAAFKIKKAPP